MKNIPWQVPALLSAFLAATAFSQITPSPVPGGSNDTSNLLASVRGIAGLWRGTPRDLGSTDWQMVQLATNASTGQPELRTNHYTELANNLNFMSGAGATAHLQASADSIRLMTNTGGAAALNGPTKVYFPATLGGSGDAPLKIVTVSNTVLRIQPMALYYFDAQSGKRVLLASAQQAQGELVGVNQAVYRSIFRDCDLRLTYTKAALESDLVMMARPKPPESYNLNSAFTRMELWHKVEGPVPVQTPTVLDSVTDPALRAGMAEPDFTDQTLDFSDLHFPQGRAFSWNGLDEPSTFDTPAQVHLPAQGADKDVIVAKKWVNLGQATALVESIRWTNIEPYLAGLPLMAGGPDPSGPVQQASLKRQLPAQGKPAGIRPAAMKVAQHGYKAKGFVWDYTTISGGGSSYTFNPGETYFISAQVSFNSAVTFGAGCTLKYVSGAFLQLYGSGYIVCSGNSTNPSVLTSMSDNAIGQTIAQSSGYPSYCGTPALWLCNVQPGQTVNYMRIRWAQTGVSYDLGGVNYFKNSCVEFCQNGLSSSLC